MNMHGRTMYVYLKKRFYSTPFIFHPSQSCIWCFDGMKLGLIKRMSSSFSRAVDLLPPSLNWVNNDFYIGSGQFYYSFPLIHPCNLMDTSPIILNGMI